MMLSVARRRLSVLALFAFVAALAAQPAAADTTPQPLPFTQLWTDISLIDAANDWSRVPGIIGYRGDNMTGGTGVDPQTVLTDGSSTPVNVIANQTLTSLATGGIAEFHLENPVVAMQGSGTARAPHLVLALDTTGFATVTVSYLLRDVDIGGDNSVQPVALQYRVGSSGSFTNVPSAFVPDASAGPNAALETPVAAVLPPAAGGQPLVQVRVITTDAAGSDEWVGIDDISVTGSNDPVDTAPTVQSTSPADGATGVDSNGDITVTFNEPVSVASGGFSVSCSILGTHPITVSGGPTAFTLSPVGPFPAATTCTATVSAAAVSDQDTIDPPDAMAADHVFSFTIAPAGPTPGSIVVSEVYGGGGNAGATYTNDFIELFNRTAGSVSLSGWSVQYASSAGSTWQVTPLTGSIPSGRNFLVQEAAGAGGTTPLPGPDVTGSIAMSGTAGKVALVASTEPLSGTCPTGGAIVDFVGYGAAANCAETAPTPTLSNTTSAQRKNGGNQDTDNNAEDFTVGAPDPQASGDQPPRVASTSPASGAAGVARDAAIQVTFSEPVNVSGDWFAIQCTTSGPHPASVSGGPVTFTLDPATDFAAGETCTVTIVGANVTDQDTDDPPDTMADTVVISFETSEVLVCGDPATRIHAIQGTEPATQMAGQPVTIEGVVVGDYQLQPSEFGGFYVQEEDGHVDGDPNTSEGIFVFDNGFGVNVEPGDLVRVRGTAGESFSLTQISNVSGVLVCDEDRTVTPAGVALPVTEIALHERTEGMLVRFGQMLTAAEVFNLGRFGEVSLSGIGRLWTPTAVALPGAPALGVAAENNRSRIILDDGNNQQNIDPTRYPQGGLTASNTLRVGDTLNGLTGVMDFRFSNYRIQPVGPISFDVGNPRTPAPAPVGGNLKVASFNVLNYFNGDGQGGGFPTSRGAINAFELERQSAKIVSALSAIDGDVVGLMEIENDGGATSALLELVRRLNDAVGAGTYAAVDTGVIGTDEIKVAVIYKPAAVTPVGDWKILTSAIDPRFDTSLNRPALAQTFEHAASGERLTVVVNHLKSKGTPCATDPDMGDGQGNCSNVRNRAAAALADWLATDPTGSGDPDRLIIGDLNAYTFEDPIRTLEAAGFVNLVRRYNGLTAYSYVFNGESGYLDHALASPSLADQATGATEWHINPDEPNVLDYTTTFKTVNQWTTFYAPGPYRASDHDPVLIGFSLNLAPEVDAGGPYTVDEGGTVALSASGSDPDGENLTYAWDLDGNGTYETPGQTGTFAAGTLDGPSTRTVGVQVTDERGKTATDTATVEIVNVAPSGTFEAPASAPAGFAFEVALTGVTDPSAADTAAGFEYAFDCGSGYGAFGASGSASCPAGAVGTLDVGAKVRDKDGGVREYRASVDVFVTLESLCDLVRAFTDDEQVADVLCDRLAKAGSAPTADAREGLLQAFRNHVRAKTGDTPGKAFTPAEGALLESLSLEL